MGDKKGALIALSSIPVIMTLGNSMLIPILPLISKELRISSFRASMLITVFGVVAILLIPVAGYLSDRLGRKAIIVPSLILAAVGGAICGVAPWFGDGQSVYWTILAGRFVQGIGAAGAFPIVIPFVGDMFEDEEDVSKGLGIIETSNTFGKVLSPILGAALGMVFWYLPFLTIPVFCLISLLLVIFLVKSPKKTKEPKKKLGEVFHDVGKVFKKEGRWLYAIFIIGGICMFLLFGVLSFLSEELEKKHDLHGVVKGLVLAIPLAVLCLASYVTGKVIGKKKNVMKWTGVAGMVLSTAALFGVGLLDNIYYMIGCLVICGAGIGIVLPCTDSLITEGIKSEIRGSVTSLYNSMRFIGVSFGPPAVSLLVASGERMMFLIIAGVSLVALLLILFAVKPKSEEKPKEKRSKAPRPAPSG